MIEPQTNVECASTSIVLTIDPLKDGIALGKHRLSSELDSRGYCFLRLAEEGRVMPLRSRYLMLNHDPIKELERQLIRISEQGLLRKTVIYLGVTTDPFFPFEGKFHLSNSILALFERYTPGLLVLQTRSPLVVLAMPMLTKLARHLTVTLGIETFREDAVARYSPGLPKVQERLKAACALRRFGINVTLQAAPLLPYGQWESDAEAFADILVNHGDFVFLRGFHDINLKNRRSLLATTLAQDRKFHWLRPDACEPLIRAVGSLAPEKLKVSTEPVLVAEQLSIFAN